MTVVVISNVATRRARRRAPTLGRVLEQRPGVTHHRTERADELTALVGHARWSASDLLVINGGDGTVQHALSLLLGHCPSARWPRVACLPGGSTNMTAFDLNRHRDFERCVATLCEVLGGAAPAEAATAARPLVAVHSACAAPRCGLFFGIGTIVQGIEYFQQRLKPGGAGYEWGAGVALARTLWGIARQQAPFDAPLEVALEAPPLGLSAASPSNVRLLFATTLKRLFLGIRPYWREGDGPLRTTLVERRAPHLIRHMPRLLRGRPGPDMTPQHGYHSRGLEALTLTFRGSYTLDGELFPVGGEGPETIDVHPSDAVRFVPL